MAFFVNENIHTRTFTPRDYHVELIAAAKEKNIIVCLDQNKEFIVHQLVTEFSQDLQNGQKVIYLSDSEYAFNLLLHLTNFRVALLPPDEPASFETFDNDIVLLSLESFLTALDDDCISLDFVRLLVVDECHRHYGKPEIHKLFNHYYEETDQKPRVLGLAGALHNARCELGRLGAELEYLEKLMRSKAETASDISTVLRYCQKPTEILLQCSPPDRNALTEYIKRTVAEQKTFLNDHRYDMSEIYGDEGYREELNAIPDPRIEPLKFFNDFLFILDELGPWCADRAAFSFLVKLERQKVKTKYERHFLLLCMVSTAIIQIRSLCSQIFDELPNRVTQVETYSTPKVLRVLEVLRHFKPDDKSGLNGLREHLQCEMFRDMQIEHYVNGIDQVGKRIDTISKDLDTLKGKVHDLHNGGERSPVKAFRARKKYHPRQPRQNMYQNDPDSLCGIIFCNSKLIAKGLFSLLCELSKHDVQLQFLNVQYTVEKVADAVTDPREAENEHRKQEEVLKRFRMHECNLLIGTAVLEEGIELPKCNLVIRWDPPDNYQSYVQCKGRARAPKAYHVMLVGTNPETEDVVDEAVKHLLGCNSDTENPMLYLRRPKSESESSDETDAASEAKPKADVPDVSSSNIPETTDASENIHENPDPDASENIHESPDSDASENIPNSETTSLPPVNTPCVFKGAQFQATPLPTEPLDDCTQEIIQKLAAYMEIEKMLLQKCENIEPPEMESDEADLYTGCIEPFKPLEATDGPAADLYNAIALVNRYCAKLPSDTFTKLTPLWRCSRTVRHGHTLFQYTVRLPINSPLKQDVTGVPMPSRILARRMAALVTCKTLHELGELDDALRPIGKEGFSANEPDWESFDLEEQDEKIIKENIEPRPGTTKRRQYYYKKIASAFNNCRPTVGEKIYFYFIKMILTCPIPEEQNTRGRKIYPPEDSVQGFGILTVKKIPKVSAFPIFTRSGEVQVSLELISTELILNEDQLSKINTFINYTFTKVLRLQKYLMLFDPEATENCFFIVPTLENGDRIDVDWDFLRVIEENVNTFPTFVPDEVRKSQAFDSNKFKDAVVMPWYRNQDQPQYFYVAEICGYLSPNSSFPGDNYSTFKEYYYKKYGIEIQNPKQPLLDVDHTGARLNFLTPRYVNRKGVALPTSSEETKRAKRENLEQKQILVPELCTIHPFSASLWRAAVCLPCILYRINALLLADEIRKKVAFDLDLGHQRIEDETFQWPMLNFGWSLADVLRKSREAKERKEIEDAPKKDEHEPVQEKEKEVEEPEVAEEKTENEILEEAAAKQKKSDELEIGMWTNDMAANIRDEWDSPGNISMCTPPNSRVRYGSPTSWMQNGADQSDDCSDSDSYQSDIVSDNEETVDAKEFGLKIEFKSDNTAEAIDTEEDIAKRQRQLEAISVINNRVNKTHFDASGFGCLPEVGDLPERIMHHEENCTKSIQEFKEAIKSSDLLVKYNQPVAIDRTQKKINRESLETKTCAQLVPWSKVPGGRITLQELLDLNQGYLSQIDCEKHIVEGTGDVFDNFIDSVNLQVSTKELSVYASKVPLQHREESKRKIENPIEGFSFDYQPDLNESPGPSPSIILHALTMSNANDGINLERLETIGDSFLKYAITTYLYLKYENVHEGKLSHLRSKQVSNLNLYRLGRRKILGESMIATKFEPHDNWLPPCYYVPKELEQALIAAKIPACHWNLADLASIKQLSSEEVCRLVKDRAEEMGYVDGDDDSDSYSVDDFPSFIPYNLVTQHSIPDKSIADCVEALIGAYLIECGPKGALLFMAWLGIRVLPLKDNIENIHELTNGNKDCLKFELLYEDWPKPKTPLLPHVPNEKATLDRLLTGFDEFETAIGYRFRDRSYLLQAMTHASYSPNRLTDCYQRLEFLGDAVLDYLITRHLYEDPRQHSPGALTDLRSALVNNTIFASLAVRHGFHKYFRHLSPSLSDVIDRFVRIQHENGHCISEDFYLLSEEECDEAEDVEVPKALGDVFESVAGAIFLDSNMSLDAVWMVYSNMMGPEIEQFSNSVPKSPIRELLELEPETAKFGKPEKLADGRRVRVTVEVFGKGTYRGIGRNYRIAKCTAAKCALRQLKKLGIANKKQLKSS